MIRNAWVGALGLSLVCVGLAGCGVSVPNIAEVWDADRPANPVTGELRISATAQIEFGIKKKVYCELKDAVKAVNDIPFQAGPSSRKLGPERKGILPREWGAQVSLSLQVDESAALSPGVTLNQPMANAISVFGPS